MKKILLIVDVQTGFLNHYNKCVAYKIKSWTEKHDYDYIIASIFINNPNTACYKQLNWKHCINDDELALAEPLQGLPNAVIYKSTYTSLTPKLRSILDRLQPDEIHVCGIATGCCVTATAYDLFDNNYPVFVIPHLCYSTIEKPGYDENIRYMLRENLNCIDEED